MVFFLQWSKEEVEIKTVSLTIVGAEQAKVRVCSLDSAVVNRVLVGGSLHAPRAQINGREHFIVHVQSAWLSLSRPYNKTTPERSKLLSRK